MKITTAVFFDVVSVRTLFQDIKRASLTIIFQRDLPMIFVDLRDRAFAPPPHPPPLPTTTSTAFPRTMMDIHPPSAVPSYLPELMAAAVELPAAKHVHNPTLASNALDIFPIPTSTASLPLSRRCETDAAKHFRQTFSQPAEA